MAPYYLYVNSVFVPMKTDFNLHIRFQNINHLPVKNTVLDFPLVAIVSCLHMITEIHCHAHGLQVTEFIFLQ